LKDVEKNPNHYVKEKDGHNNILSCLRNYDPDFPSQYMSNYLLDHLDQTESGKKKSLQLIFNLDWLSSNISLRKRSF
jgi:hypothetical protein